MIRKIRIEQLEVGMYVSDFDTPWIDHPFLGSRRKIVSLRDIRAIRDHGIAELYIDTTKGRDTAEGFRSSGDLGDGAPEPGLAEVPLPDAAQECPAEGEAQVAPAGDGTPYGEELRKAREIYTEAATVVQSMFQDVRLGRGVGGDKVRRSVEDMIGSIFRNRDALVSLVRIKSLDDYTLHHSLNVAVLSLALGVQLGILHQELQRLGIGALLHDLGKTDLPETVLMKAGPLTPEEYDLVKTHTAKGAKLILGAESIPDECAPVALNHHENYDGSGYPRGLRGAEIGKFGLIAAIADAYDACTTLRVYQQPVLPHNALQRMYGRAGKAYHPIYVRKFIQCLGIYPVGSVVRLDTGEIAVVSRQNRDSLLQPWIKVVQGRDGCHLQRSHDVDLRAADPAGAKNYARAVKNVLCPRRARIDVEGVLGHQETGPPEVPVAALLS